MMPEICNVLMPIHEIGQQCRRRNTYTVFLKFEFYIIKTQSQKFISDFNVSWIYKHETNNNHKLLSHNNLSFLGRKIYHSILLINRTPTPIPL